jgi:hypothetical protein
LDLPRDSDQLQCLVQVEPDGRKTLQARISKSASLRRIFRSPGIIQRLIGEAVAGASAENIIYPAGRGPQCAGDKLEVGLLRVTASRNTGTAKHGMKR